MFHKTGTIGADDWYKNAFKPFLDGGLHSGEVGGPDVGAAFKTVFNATVMRGREAENETVAVAFVHPKASTDLIAKFFDDKNPFWPRAGCSARSPTSRPRLSWFAGRTRKPGSLRSGRKETASSSRRSG